MDKQELIDKLNELKKQKKEVSDKWLIATVDHKRKMKKQLENMLLRIDNSIEVVETSLQDLARIERKNAIKRIYGVNYDRQIS